MEKPILFNTEMVQAIFNDRKTNTRRVINPQPIYHPEWGTTGYEWKKMILTSSQYHDRMIEKCPYGKKGNLLWVREKFRTEKPFTGNFEKDIYGEDVTYYASDHEKYRDNEKWKPSIFMPKKYCRLWLEVVDVSVERVQDITEEDAEAEGINFLRYVPDVDERLTAKQFFECLWDSINKKRGYGWDLNPWVWSVKFKRLQEKI